MKFYKPILALSAIILLFSGCYYDKEDQLYPNSVNCDVTNVTFSGTIQPLMNLRCATPSCHGGTQPPNLTTYTNISANLARVKVRAIDLKTMPSSGPLSDCEISKLQKWIDAGALNN